MNDEFKTKWGKGGSVPFYCTVLMFVRERERELMNTCSQNRPPTG
jgi:hypothetical protein